MMKEEKKYYWIGLVGAGCGATSWPLTREEIQQGAFQNFPEPFWQYIGFPTAEEQKQVQHHCLTAPIEEVEAAMDRLAPRVQSGEVAVIGGAKTEEEKWVRLGILGDDLDTLLRWHKVKKTNKQGK